MNFKRKIKKFFRKIKVNIESRKIISTVLVTALCFSIISIKFQNNVKAYPSQWDGYIDIDENSDIKDVELKEMDKYKDNFKVVPTGSEVKSNPHGRVQVGSTFDYKYTDMTIDKDKKQVSRWFLSAYGPFFDYISSNRNEHLSNIAIVLRANEGAA